MRRLLVALVVVVVVLGGAYLLGMRLFVMTPADIPGGATILTMAAPDLNIVDSPAAYCMRHAGTASPTCKSGINLTIAQGSILARFGYSGWLYGLSGAPAEAS